MAGTQILSLTLAEYLSRSLFVCITSLWLETEKKFLTEDQQPSLRKHEGLFLVLVFNEEQNIFKGK